jgi:hypothetical protein
MKIAREEAAAAEFELTYRYGSFPKKECFSGLDEAVARLRSLSSGTPAHSFTISSQGKVLMSGLEMVRPADSTGR